MIKPIPDIVIDSWDDLFMNKELKIFCSDSNVINTFSNKENSAMALNFRSRIEQHQISITQEFKTLIMTKLKSGRYVYITGKYNIIDILIWASDNDKEWLKTFHLSRYGFANLPVFFIINGNMDKNLFKLLNNM